MAECQDPANTLRCRLMLPLRDRQEFAGHFWRRQWVTCGREATVPGESQEERRSQSGQPGVGGNPTALDHMVRDPASAAGGLVWPHSEVDGDELMIDAHRHAPVVNRAGPDARVSIDAALTTTPQTHP